MFTEMSWQALIVLFIGRSWQALMDPYTLSCLLLVALYRHWWTHTHWSCLLLVALYRHWWTRMLKTSQLRSYQVPEHEKYTSNNDFTLVYVELPACLYCMDFRILISFLVVQIEYTMVIPFPSSFFFKNGKFSVIVRTMLKPLIWLDLPFGWRCLTACHAK